MLKMWVTRHLNLLTGPVLFSGCTQVEKSMPTFYKNAKKLFRNVEEGADTIVYLSVSDEALKLGSGGFFFDRQAASKHLFLGGTEYNEEDVNKLVQRLCKIAEDKGISLPK